MKKVLIISLLCGINGLAAMEQDNFDQKNREEDITSQTTKKRKFTPEEIDKSLVPSATLFKELIDSLDTVYTSLKILDSKDKKITPLIRHVLKTTLGKTGWKYSYLPSDIVKKRAAEEVLKDIQDKEISSSDNSEVDSKTILHECLIQYAALYPDDIKNEINNLQVPAVFSYQMVNDSN